MVKLEHGKILDTAVHAGAVREVIPQLLAISNAIAGVVLCGAPFIGFWIAEIVHSRDFAHACATDSYANSPVGVFKAKARKIEDLATPAALRRVLKGGPVHPEL